MNLLHKTSRLTNRIVKSNTKIGLSPGTFEYIGARRGGPVEIEVIDYKDSHYEKRIVHSPEDCSPFLKSKTISWINITGVHDEEVIKNLASIFGIHPLTQEDIANTTQRPKVEEYDNYLFVVLKMAYVDEDTGELITEQVSLVVGKNYVISFQERPGDILEPLRQRIEASKGKIGDRGSDYLAYAISDIIVDHYFVILEQLSEEVERIEEKLLKNSGHKILNEIYRLKREIIVLRKSIWPMREVVHNLERNEYALVKKATRIYIRDLYDHTVQVLETIETFREVVAGMLDLHISNNSNKMNEVMKVLTVFASIFIPLTFIVGVYGMNFDYMPELRLKYGYHGLWAIMISVTVAMLAYFKNKKWL